MVDIIRPGEKIIDDNSPENDFNPAGVRKGYEGMHRRGYANARFSAMPDSMLIDKSEWRDRINAKQKDQAQVSDLLIYKKLPPKNQASTSYCWNTAPVGGYEAQRVIMNMPYVEFSNASVGGPVTGFKDRGGWGDDALDQMENAGVCPSEFWPNNAINKKYYTAENKQRAMENRIADGWWKLEGGHIEQVASLALQNIITQVGYDWWGHEVYVCDLLWDGDFMFRIRNSWGDIPDFPNGFGILKGRKMIPSDAVAFRQVTV
jgi:hypothetical protein